MAVRGVGWLWLLAPAVALHVVVNETSDLTGTQINLNAMQWNPHYECFSEKHAACKSNGEAALTSWLEQHDVDFANIVMLEDEEYIPPAAYKTTSTKCGVDSHGSASPADPQTAL